MIESVNRLERSPSLCLVSLPSARPYRPGRCGSLAHQAMAIPLAHSPPAALWLTNPGVCGTTNLTNFSLIQRRSPVHLPIPEFTIPPSVLCQRPFRLSSTPPDLARNRSLTNQAGSFRIFVHVGFQITPPPHRTFSRNAKTVAGWVPGGVYKAIFKFEEWAETIS